MHSISRCLLLSSLFSLSLASLQAQSVSVVETTPDLKHALTPQPALSFAASATGGKVLTVDDTQRFQTIDGYGAAMTDSSAWLLEEQLTPAQRKEVMQKLFSPHAGIGISFIRVPLGASDLARNHYSYDEMPKGERDPGLTHFSIDHDREYILPAMRQALALNPSISVMVTPWSPPGWMKTKDSMIGGQILPEAGADFADYLAKSVIAYEKAGIPVNYLSLQNEPLYETKDYPGTLMLASQQKELIAKFVGPALKKASPQTSILAYDHNWDHPEYPEEVLADAEAAPYVAGAAFHCYGGDVSAQVSVHDHYPNKGLWMTECSGGTWQKGNLLAVTAKLIIESSQNWSKAIVLWGLALDEKNGPNAGGCATCRGFVTIDRSKNRHQPTYTVDYYAIGHASKFVHPGAVRIATNDLSTEGLESVAFQNRDGSIILLVLNNTEAPNDFQISWRGRSVHASVSAGSMATYTWRSAKK